MALINCSECGNKVSDKANSCPKCGNPINESKDKGKVIIHGFSGFFINNPIVNIFVDNKKIGSVQKDGLLNILIDEDKEIVFELKNKKSSIFAKANQVTEVQLIWDSTWGKIISKVIDTKPIGEVSTNNKISKNKRGNNNKNIKGKKYNTSIIKKNVYGPFIMTLFLTIICLIIGYFFSGWSFVAALIGFIGIFGGIPLSIKGFIDCSSDQVVFYKCPNCEHDMNVYSSNLEKAPYDTYESKCGYCFSKITFDFNENKVYAEETEEKNDN